LCIFGFGYIGDSIAFLKSEIKSQEKHVKTLKKRCLWSKVLEEVCYVLLPHVGSKTHCDLLHKWWAMLWWCPWTAQTKSSCPEMAKIRSVPLNGNDYIHWRQRNWIFYMEKWKIIFAD
jgi:hypothetical protein